MIGTPPFILVAGITEWCSAVRGIASFGRMGIKKRFRLPKA
jgi:hypothetical protein